MMRFKIAIPVLFLTNVFILFVNDVQTTPTARRNGKIAFTSARDGDYEIYTMNSDGSGQTRLTFNSVPDDCARWSPDGKTIAFIRNVQNGISLFLMNQDGTEQRRIDQSLYIDGSCPSWSPDGGKLAFSAARDIWTIDLATHVKVNLSTSASWEIEPSWSPDGTKISYGRYLNDQGFYSRIWVMNADGSDQKQIGGGTWTYTSTDFSDWQGSTNRIVFAEASDDMDNNNRLVSVMPNGLMPITIFSLANIQSGNFWELSRPRVSPDGSKILIQLASCYSQSMFCSDIGVINSDGSNFHVLDPSMHEDWNPDWQPKTTNLDFTVTRSDDRNAVCSPGDCSLREAVNAANASEYDDVINFAPGLTRITLTDEIVIYDAGALSVIGPGANLLTIDAGPGRNRIFSTIGGMPNISGVTLTGGNIAKNAGVAGAGGAIHANGSLTLEGVYVTGNSAVYGGGLLLENGLFAIYNSTISDNSSTEHGGGLYVYGMALVVNSTISGNNSAQGGGLWLFDEGEVSLYNVTITNNSANFAGGIFTYYVPVNLANTIVAGNAATEFPEIGHPSFAVSKGGNLIGDSPGDSPAGMVYQPSDIRDTDSLLGPLRNNGGPTMTQALRPGSPAINAGDNCVLTENGCGDGNPGLPTDQRGFGRNGAVDIGAFERQQNDVNFGSTKFDYDGDGKSDISVWRPSTGVWYMIQSGSSTMKAQGWGLNGNKLAPADFDGDGKTDLAVFRPNEGNWYIINSETNTVTVAGWGLPDDLLVPADYSGDGKADLAIYRPSEGKWYRRDSDGKLHIYEWGLPGDKPAPADFNGDGVADMTVFRPSEGKWYILNSGNASISVFNWGQDGDLPVPGDYSGDGRSDFAVFRPSNQTWYSINPINFAMQVITWGIPGDLPTPGDYDGDGRQDLAVFRPSNSTWFINSSTGGIYSQPFGLAGDVPVENAFVY